MEWLRTTFKLSGIFLSLENHAECSVYYVCIVGFFCQYNSYSIYVKQVLYILSVQLFILWSFIWKDDHIWGESFEFEAIMFF